MTDSYGMRTLALGDDEQRVVFGVEDLCRHTLVFGASGSGKTTRAYNPLLAKMLVELDAGAFVIAASSDAVRETVELARRAGKEAVVVEPGGSTGLDLLSGSPDLDAMYFRDTYGHVNADAKQWVDAAVARMKNALRILQAAGNRYYTFEYLTSYCFDDKFAAMLRIQATDRLHALPQESDEAWTIREAIAYEETRFAQFTPETRRSIQFAVSQLLEPLRDVLINKTFARRTTLVQFEAAFGGTVIVLHVPRTRYERAAAAIYTLAKRRFFTALERRRDDPAVDQQRPIVFGVDEYERCISESDIASLGAIRAAGCMVLATTKSVSSIGSVMPRHQVNAAIQNFTQKIFFKTDDEETLALLERVTRGGHGKADAATLFGMNRNQALCHLTVGDESVVAVLAMQPLFLTPPRGHLTVPDFTTDA
jgi:type IV secretory pathway TraG/TraD family ATPase VirD4